MVALRLCKTCEDFDDFFRWCCLDWNGEETCPPDLERRKGEDKTIQLSFKPTFLLGLKEERREKNGD